MKEGDYITFAHCGQEKSGRIAKKFSNTQGVEFVVIIVASYGLRFYEREIVMEINTLRSLLV